MLPRTRDQRCSVMSSWLAHMMILALLMLIIHSDLVASRHAGKDFPTQLVNLHRISRAMSDNEVNPEVYCIDREPCKYAKAALVDNKLNYKEIDSWCRCKPDEDCVFGSRDYSRKLHLYRCKSKRLIEEEDQGTFEEINYF